MFEHVLRLVAALTLRVLRAVHSHHRLHAVEALGVRPEVAPLLTLLKGLQLRPKLWTRDRLLPGQLPLLSLKSQILNIIGVNVFLCCFSTLTVSYIAVSFSTSPRPVSSMSPLSSLLVCSPLGARVTLPVLEAVMTRPEAE